MLISGALLGLKDYFGQKRATQSDAYIDHTVTSSDVSSNGYKKRDDQEIITRVRQHVLNAALINTRSCVQHPMRLYRRKGAAGSKAWGPGKQLDRHELKKYHANPFKGKAAAYAGSDDFEEVMYAPPLDLLSAANPTRKGSTWMKDCWLQWWIFGKRYVHHVDGGPRGAPSMLWLMRAHDVGHVIARDETMIVGFRYGRSGQTAIFPADEVMYQVMTPSPFNPFDAIAPIHSIFVEADIYAASTASEKAMWENGARPDYALSFKGEKTAEQIKQAQEMVNRELRGPTKRGKMLATSEAVVVPLNFSPREMEYLAGRSDIKNDIYNAFGIPESMREMNDSNRASAEAGLVQYARHTIAPALIQDAEEWTESYLPLWGIDPGEYWFAYDNPVPEDRASIRADIQAFVKKPVWTVDEARAELGYDPSDELNDEPEEDPATPSDPNMPDDSEDDPEDSPEDAPVKKAHRCGPACGHGAKALDTEAPQEAPAELSPQEQAVARDMLQALLPWFLLLAATVTVRRVSERTDAPEDLTVTAGDYVASLGGIATTGFSERVKPIIRRALQLGANDGVALVPQPSGSGTSPGGPAIGAPVSPPSRITLDAAFDVVNEWAPKHLDEYTIKLARQVNKTTLDAIKQTIKEAIAQGASQPQVIQMVQAELQGMAPDRAKLIAVTETRRAYNYGNLLLWKKAGAWGKRIILAANPCPICIAIADAYNATGLDINEPFWSLGEPLEIGDGMSVTNNYQDADAPPFHPNCFCVLQPVFDPLGGGE